jgi:hypothetical protein
MTTDLRSIFIYPKYISMSLIGWRADVDDTEGNDDYYSMCTLLNHNVCNSVVLL